jgi:hypothetical protein
MGSQLGQRLIGLLLLAGSIGFTIWVWNLAAKDGDYYESAAAIFPALAIIGLGLLIFPIDKQALRKKYGTDKIERWHMAPLEWKVLFVGAIACGLGSLILMWKHEKAREARQREIAPADQRPYRMEEPTAEERNEPAHPVAEATPREPSWRNHLLLPAGLLAIIGAFVTMIGMMWNKGARLLTFFSERTNPESGMRVFWVGAAMLAVGLATLFLAAR